MPSKYGRSSYKGGYKKSYRKKPSYSAKGSVRAYATRFTKRDKFSTLSNSPSALPAPLRAGQGPYSRGVFARAAVRSDLEIKNNDNASAWSTMTVSTPPPATANPLTAAAYITTAGTLAPIAQNSTSSGREGRKVVVKGIESRFVFTLTSTATPDNTTMKARLLTVLDRQANGLTPLEADLFVVAAEKVNNMINMDNAQRFVILQDESFELNANSAIGAGCVTPSKSKIIKKVCNIPMEFANTTGTLADIRSNNIYHVLLITGAGSLSSWGRTRVYYVG